MSWIFSAISKAFSSSTANPEEMQAAKSAIEKLISQYPVAVFSKSYCPYCTRAKDLLANSFPQSSIGTIELDDRDDGSNLQSALAERANKGRVTVPQVYLKGRLIGGSDDLAAFSRTSDFQELIKSIKAESKL